MNTCSDCGFAPRQTGDEALMRGSNVREPGEALCAGCSSRRTLMVREVGRIPDSISAIKALRAPAVGKS